MAVRLSGGMLNRQPTHPKIALSGFLLLGLTPLFMSLPACGQEESARQSGLEALSQKRYDEAEKIFQANLDALIKSGCHDEKLGIAYVDISGAYNQEKKYEQAEMALRRAIAIFEAIEPDRGANTLMSSNLLEQVLEQEQKYKEAETILSDLKEFYAKSYAGNRLMIGLLRSEAALLQKIGGRDEEAQAMLDQAAQIEKTNAPLAPQLEKLSSGDQAQQQKDWQKAENDYKAAAAAVEKEYGKDDLRYADSLVRLSTLYLTQKRYKEAESLARQVVAIREKKLGATSQSVAEGLRLLAAVLKEEGKMDEAVTQVDRANKIMVTQLKTVDPAMANRLQTINDNLASLRAALTAGNQAQKAGSKDEVVRQNMLAVQIVVEAYASEHGGKFPLTVNQKLSAYFSGGDKWGRAPINPFTQKAEWPVPGHLTSVNAARKVKPGALKAGTIEYTGLAGGASYAIRGGGANGLALADQATGGTFVLSNQ